MSTNFDDMQNLAARLTALAAPKQLSIPDQVVIDALLYDVGEAVKKLLEQHELHGQRSAEELANKVYYSLLEVRHALCWDSIPPTSHISDSDRKAIVAALYATPVAPLKQADADEDECPDDDKPATSPLEVIKALTEIIRFMTALHEKGDGLPEDHPILPAVDTICEWLRPATEAPNQH